VCIYVYKFQVSPIHPPLGDFQSELAVGSDRWRTGGAPDCPVRPCTGSSGNDSLVGGAIYIPFTHHIECLAGHINTHTLLEHCKHHKA
jgi:hypothetical protein